MKTHLAPAAPPIAPNAPTERAIKAANGLEAEFIKLMLKEAKVGAVPGLGKSGDQDQWLSFLHDALAERIVDKGGIGLSDHIIKRLT